MDRLSGQIARIAERLLKEPEAVDDPSALRPDWVPEKAHERPPVPAAVMIALVRRGPDMTVLYTERSSELRSHSGQVSFPGGKIDPGDEGPAGAALREAEEEVSMNPKDVSILGYMPTYFTGTNYLITPVVTLVEPRAPFVANPEEVETIFELSLEQLRLAEAYSTYDFTFRARQGRTWRIQHETKLIWGITANLTRRFYERALREDRA